MYLYMSSYKLGNKSYYLKKWIEDTKNNKILLIINARDARIQDLKEIEIINKDKKELEDIGFDVKIFDLRAFFNKKNELYKFIENNDYKAFYVIGGNVFTLRIAMKISGFDEYLIQNCNVNNILYAGYSAGICVLSRSLKAYKIVEQGVNPYNFDNIIYNGLGLIDYTFVPHYKSQHKSSELINQVISYLKKNKIKFKTIKDGDVFICNY